MLQHGARVIILFRYRRSDMDTQFVDRLLICSDCHGEFIFTAGEQLFFHDKQFKNDPKRCKPCKSRRSGLSAAAAGAGGPAAAGLSRTETRTQCSECGVETTVPFKPTQGRPVLCRQCFQMKARTVAAEPTAPAPVLSAVATADTTAAALTELSQAANGDHLSPDAATLASASMAAASPESSVASAADLASITAPESGPAPSAILAQLLTSPSEPTHAEALQAEAPDA
jgi:CxxC-x17-CxxC domain-containing protein